MCSAQVAAGHVSLPQFLAERGPENLELDGTTEPARASKVAPRLIVTEHAFSIARASRTAQGIAAAPPSS